MKVLFQAMPISDAVPLSRADLREAMRDPRDQPSGHPEGTEYWAWVSSAWREFQETQGSTNVDGLV